MDNSSVPIKSKPSDFTSHGPKQGQQLNKCIFISHTIFSNSMYQGSTSIPLWTFLVGCVATDFTKQTCETEDFYHLDKKLFDGL